MVGDNYYVETRLQGSVAAVYRHPIRTHPYTVRVGRCANRLMTGRPYQSGTQISDVTPLPMVVAGTVVPPPIDRHVAIPAVSASRVGHHRRIPGAAEQRDAGQWRVRRVGQAGSAQLVV